MIYFYLFFKDFFFWFGPFLKSLLNLLQYCFCFLFWFFGPKACGILAPWPGIKPVPPELEGKVLTTGPPGESCDLLLKHVFKVHVIALKFSKIKGRDQVFILPFYMYTCASGKTNNWWGKVSLYRRRQKDRIRIFQFSAPSNKLMNLGNSHHWLVALQKERDQALCAPQRKYTRYLWSSLVIKSTQSVIKLLALTTNLIYKQQKNIHNTTMISQQNPDCRKF